MWQVLEWDMSVVRSVEQRFEVLQKRVTKELQIVTVDNQNVLTRTTITMIVAAI